MKYKGRFGDYGGFYVPEVLIPALEELEKAFYKFYKDKGFIGELSRLMADYAGRPTPLYYAKRFSEYVGFKVYLKREDLLHGGRTRSITLWARDCSQNIWAKQNSSPKPAPASTAWPPR